MSEYIKMAIITKDGGILDLEDSTGILHHEKLNISQIGFKGGVLTLSDKELRVILEKIEALEIFPKKSDKKPSISEKSESVHELSPTTPFWVIEKIGDKLVLVEFISAIEMNNYLCDETVSYGEEGMDYNPVAQSLTTEILQYKVKSENDDIEGEKYQREQEEKEKGQ